MQAKCIGEGGEVINTALLKNSGNGYSLYRVHTGPGFVHGLAWHGPTQVSDPFTLRVINRAQLQSAFHMVVWNGSCPRAYKMASTLLRAKAAVRTFFTLCRCLLLLGGDTDALTSKVSNLEGLFLPPGRHA